jgi:hypothetical protein
MAASTEKIHAREGCVASRRTKENVETHLIETTETVVEEEKDKIEIVIERAERVEGKGIEDPAVALMKESTDVGIEKNPVIQALKKVERRRSRIKKEVKIHIQTRNSRSLSQKILRWIICKL